MSIAHLLHKLGKKRTFILRSASLAGIAIALLLEPHWPQLPAADLALEFLGQLLVVVGVLGRLWSTLYISGRKSRELVVSGPYSLCRNPLYLFSFLLCLGALLLLKNGVLLLMFLAFFLLFHSIAIREEEKKLADRFGEAYENYRRRVPRLFPRLGRISHPGDGGEAETALPCNPRQALRGVFDTGLYLMLIPLAKLWEHLYQSGLLPLP